MQCSYKYVLAYVVKFLLNEKRNLKREILAHLNISYVFSAVMEYELFVISSALWILLPSSSLATCVKFSREYFAQFV